MYTLTIMYTSQRCIQFLSSVTFKHAVYIDVHKHFSVFTSRSYWNQVHVHYPHSSIHSCIRPKTHLFIWNIIKWIYYCDMNWQIFPIRLNHTYPSINSHGRLSATFLYKRMTVSSIGWQTISNRCSFESLNCTQTTFCPHLKQPSLVKCASYIITRNICRLWFYSRICNIAIMLHWVCAAHCIFNRHEKDINLSQGKKF